jgi:hypothetical protein
VLCYEFADDGHWGDAISPAGQASEPPMRTRQRRLRIVAAVLSPYGLTVSDPGVGRQVVISNRTGACELATVLPTVWQAAQRLCARRIDVLDEALLEALAGGPST